MKPLFLFSKIFSRQWPLGILVLSLSGAYLYTLAPGLTWANAGSDGGDLITAAFTNGIAHPTGYPLYLLLARLFQFLPIGSLAYRTNVMSATATVIAALLVYKIVTRSLAGSDHEHTWHAGLIAGLSFGLAPLVWSQAVITEVYALQSLLTALILYLYAGPTPASAVARKQLDSWRGLVLGLALGNHVTTLLLVPMALLLGSSHRQLELDSDPNPKHTWHGNLKFDLTSLRRQLLWFGVGVTLYLLLPLRALAYPPVNWGNVVTPGRLWWLVSGQLYQNYYFQFSLPAVLERIQAWAALLLQQFGFPGVVVGLIGLVVFGTRSRLYILTIWTTVAVTTFAIIYRSDDSYVYLIPMLLSFAIWMGLGTAGLTHLLARWPSIFRVVLGLLVIGYFAIRFESLVSQVDASQDHRAESFGREILSAVPANAIVFANGDRAVFSLWYFHFALGERPDLAVVAADLLHFDWYQENLRSIYPVLVVPGPFPWPETIARANPTRVVCYVQYTDQPEVDCNVGVNSP